MGTIFKDNTETHTLQVGQVMTVTANASSSALIFRMRTPTDAYPGSVVINAGESSAIGPYNRQATLDVSCLSGSVDAVVSTQNSTFDDANAAVVNDNAGSGTFTTVANQAAMLALSTAVAGDEVYRTDLGTVWKLRVAPASTLGNWVQLAAGGGIAASSGSDITLATVGAYGVATYTSGAQWVVNYDGSGVPLSEYLAGDASLISNLTSAGGGIYYVSSGLKHVSGLLQMTLAQRTTWTALTPTIAVGYELFITNAGSVTDAAGAVTVPGARCYWAGTTLQWLWTTPVRYAAYQTGTTVNFASGALGISRQIDIAGGIIGPYDQVFLGTSWSLTGAAGVRRIQMNIGSQLLYDNASIAAVSVQSLGILKTLNGVGVNSQIVSGATTQPYDGPGLVAAAISTVAVDTSVTTAVTAKATLVSGDTATCRFLIATVSSTSGVWG